MQAYSLGTADQHRPWEPACVTLDVINKLAWLWHTNMIPLIKTRWSNCTCACSAFPSVQPLEAYLPVWNRISYTLYVLVIRHIHSGEEPEWESDLYTDRHVTCNLYTGEPFHCPWLGAWLSKACSNVTCNLINFILPDTHARTKSRSKSIEKYLKCNANWEA